MWDSLSIHESSFRVMDGAISAQVFRQPPLPYTGDQTTSDMLVYNFQPPYKSDQWHFSSRPFGETFATTSGEKCQRQVRFDRDDRQGGLEKT